mgnify:CR=1 FL=1
MPLRPLRQSRRPLLLHADHKARLIARLAERELGDLRQARELIARSFPMKTYEPEGFFWREAQERFAKLMEKDDLGHDTMDLSDPEVRALWLELGSSALSIGALGGGMRATSLIAKGTRMSKVGANVVAGMTVAGNLTDAVANRELGTALGIAFTFGVRWLVQTKLPLMTIEVRMSWTIMAIVVGIGGGVFSALYRHVESLASDAPGVIGLRLYVEDNNAKAQQTYEALGMVKPGYLVMETPLAKSSTESEN